MLDPFVIEEIRRREREQQDKIDQGYQMPMYIPLPPPNYREEEASPPPSDRGVTIIEF